MQEKDDSVLGPYRVLDLADEKGLLCGKILGDFGADVIKIEKPGGDAARNLGPFYHDEVDPEKSLFWFALNNNKRGITLNLETEEGRDIFRKLVKTADFVIETFSPGYLDGLGLGYTDLEKINPGVIMVSITPFGQTGPYRDYKTSDIVAWAAGGDMAPWGDSDRPPIHVSHHSQAFFNAGADGAQGALTALYYRHMTGEGQQVDVSVQEAVVQCTEHITSAWDLGHRISKRVPPETTPGAKLTQIWPCKDGHVSWFYWGGVMSLRTNVPMVKWMEAEGEANDYLLNYDWANFGMEVNPEELAQIEEPTARFILKRTKAELFAGALKHGVQLYPVSTPKDMLASPQLEARNFFAKVEHPELNDTITYPGSFSGTEVARPKISRRAPLIGEHNSEVYGELGISGDELKKLSEAGTI
ncbi:MAG: CoA transferase [Dehalococcoidales bacterium]|nr:CoA transferase [Dehalococcoidales bacterium]